MQLYCGNFLGGGAGEGGFKQHDGLCLETQQLSRFAEQARFPQRRAAAGADVSLDDDASVFGGEIAGGPSRCERTRV